MIRYCRTSEVACYTGISESRLEKLRVAGDGPAFIKSGRTVLYSLDDVDAWMKACRRQSTSDTGQSVEN
jgi:excisionase family DNA binding protein